MWTRTEKGVTDARLKSLISIGPHSKMRTAPPKIVTRRKRALSLRQTGGQTDLWSAAHVGPLRM
jgi:hypothetical protein